MRATSVLLAVCAALIMAGCASPARVDQMMSTGYGMKSIPADSPLKEQVSIKEVTGGRETNPMWVSNVSSTDFERALEGSLKAAELLNPARTAGRFQLTADLMGLNQPMFGLDMTVTATVRYSVIDRNTGLEIFSRSMPTAYTAKWGDAFIGAERLKLANEGAIRVNIENLITDLSSLRIKVSMN
jgi:hypothetical protein